MSEAKVIGFNGKRSITEKKTEVIGDVPISGSLPVENIVYRINGAGDV